MAINKRCIMECVDADGKPRMARLTRDTCAVCGANMAGWLRRRPAERLKYRAVLALRGRRMEAVTTEKHEGKFEVIDIRPHLKNRKVAKAKRLA